MKKTILCLALSALLSTSAFAEVDVVDESQNFAFNEEITAPTENFASEDESVMVLSENRQNPSIQANEIKDDSESSTMQLLLSKVEAMQLELAELRGMVEQQKHQLELVGVVKSNSSLSSERTDNKAQAKNDASHVVAMEQAADVSGKASHRNDPVDEQLSYVEAYEHVKHKRYQKAIPAMEAFIQQYPDGPYAANAHYWLGELFAFQGEYSQAIAQFKVVLNEFSDSMKVSSAHYKLGVVYEKLGKMELAQSEYLKVTEAFPGTAVAQLAQSRLKEIEQGPNG